MEKGFFLYDCFSLLFVLVIVMEILRIGNLLFIVLFYVIFIDIILCGYCVLKDIIVFVNMEFIYLDLKFWEDFIVFNFYCYLDKDGKLIIN